ncbi:MAG: hypothetical protein ACLFSQ_01700 [Candidatus Zixiibacteriota bacterium]
MTIAIYIAMPKSLYQSLEYGAWKAIFDYIENNIEAGKSYNIVIGDSRAQHGINAKTLNAINLSTGGTTPVEGYYQLKLILEKSQIDTLYISYAPIHLDHQDCFFTRTVYYNFVDRAYVDNVFTDNTDPNYQVDAYELAGFDWFVKAYHITNDLHIATRVQDFYEFIKFGLINISDNIMHGRKMRRQFTHGYTDFSEDESMANIDSCEIETIEYEFEKTGIPSSTINVEYLGKIKAICDANDIAYIFIILPVPRKSMKPEHEYYVKYRDTIYGLFPNKVIFGGFYYPNKYFKDRSHLNKDGVEYFGRIIERQLDMMQQKSKEKDR